ncbi:hypothetical protein J2W39_006555 [Variovorax paradoxus]|uniref:Transposase IS66 C-terminal domain-containing protein n=2 Tax=Variovorax paradoxus TaxID=34073 RepID=A0AAW8EQW2_VARPD|nr:hypothetical protein [Variovorax paradoxus]
MAGATASANSYSLIETAKANNVELYWYVVGCPRSCRLQTVDNYEALLPWNIELRRTVDLCARTNSGAARKSVVD